MSVSARHNDVEPPHVPLNASTFRARLEDARRARRHVVETFDDARIVAALAAAAGSWLDRRDPLRSRTIASLSKVSGQRAEMLAAGVDLIFGAVSCDALRELLQSEAQTQDASRRARPEIVFYALAGNVPGQGVPAIVASLLARSIVVIRDSARQPFLTDAFRATIARIEPQLGAMILPVSWSSARAATEDRELEQLVVGMAGRIALFGSDATLDALASRYSRGAHGSLDLYATRMSAGIVDASAGLDAAADSFALDIVMYEGRGCLTPHAVLVEGPPARAHEVCDRLAAGLDRREDAWPRARGTLAEEVVRRAYIDSAETAALADPDCVSVRIGGGAVWCIRFGGDEPLALGPGLRCVRVLSARDRDETVAMLARAATPLACVGLASGDERAIAELDRQLASLSVTLVSAAGRMQGPPLGWQHGNERRVGGPSESRP